MHVTSKIAYGQIKDFKIGQQQPLEKLQNALLSSTVMNLIATCHDKFIISKITTSECL